MREEGEIIGDGSSSLNPHSFKDPSIKSHQLGVAGSRVMRIIGSQASDS